MFQIGVIVESFQKPILQAVEQAHKLGIKGIQLYATGGEFDADTVSREKVCRLKNILNDNGMVVSALCGDMGGHGFAIKEDNIFKVEKSRRIMDMCLELGATVVPTHIGVIPEDKSSKKYENMFEACSKIAAHAAKNNGKFAIETGPEKVSVLKSFLETVNSKGLAVNYDPANLHMVTGEDEVAGVYALKDYIVHTHAKDGIPGVKSDPKAVYDFFAEGGIGDLNLKEYFTETALGLGGVDFDNYLKALREIGYNGFLTIEREITSTPEKDISQAVSFLKNLCRTI